MGSVSLSIEVEVPEDIEPDGLLAVGKRCAPEEWRDGMSPEEALQWAFNDPGGPQMLAQLGIDWHTIRNGAQK